MKTTFITRTATLAVASFLSFPLTSQAKDKHHGHDSHYDSHYDGHHDSHYYSYPRSSFTLSFGTGYAGRGYYYGPPYSSYYYERPEVRYYATRTVVPREYYRTYSVELSVQRELSNRGYYHGAIDGAIGPQSRNAIARYQQDHGLSVTGYITSSLLNSLGL